MIPRNPLLLPKINKHANHSELCIIQYMLDLLSQPTAISTLEYVREYNPYVPSESYKVEYQYLDAKCSNEEYRQIRIHLAIRLYSNESGSLLLDQTNVIDVTIINSTMVAECTGVITENCGGTHSRSNTKVLYYIGRRDIDLYKPDFPEIHEMLQLIPLSIIKHYLKQRSAMWY